VQIHEVSDDRKPQPQPAVPSADRAVFLPEAIEHVRQELRLDALAGVRDADLHLVASRRELDIDVPAGSRELDGVGEQVADHLLQSRGIAPDQPGHLTQQRYDLHVLGLRRRLHRGDRALDDAARRDISQLERNLARHDARDVQQVLDEALLRPGIALYRLVRARLRRLIESPGAQQRDPSEDRIERRAQLMRHGSQELVLQPAQLFSLTAQQLLPRQQRFALVLGMQPLLDLSAQPLIGAHQFGRALRDARLELLIRARERRPGRKEIEEHRNLRPHYGRDDGHLDVIDDAHRVSAGALHVICVGRDQDDGRVPCVAVLTQELGSLQPVHAGHVNVEQNEGELLVEHALQRLFAGLRHNDLGVQALEGRAVNHAFLRQVIDDQNSRPGRGGLASRGSRTIAGI